jgi:hypothetical protein
LTKWLFLGDDLNDLECMRLCGISACPADATAAVRQICTYVSPCRGGEGGCPGHYRMADQPEADSGGGSPVKGYFHDQDGICPAASSGYVYRGNQSILRR